MPNTCASVDFGNAEYIRITRNANSFVRICKSFGSWFFLSSFTIHPSSFFILYSSLIIQPSSLILPPDAGERGLDLLLEAGDQFAISGDQRLLGFDLGDDGLLGFEGWDRYFELL